MVRKEGVVTEALPGALFRVRLDKEAKEEIEESEKGGDEENETEGREILAHLSGKMRMYRIRIIPGDTVIMELPSEDADRARIVYRK